QQEINSQFDQKQTISQDPFTFENEKYDFNNHFLHENEENNSNFNQFHGSQLPFTRQPISNIVDFHILAYLGISTDNQTIEILESPIKKVFSSEIPIDMLKLLRLKFEMKPFVILLKELEKLDKIELTDESNIIKIKKKPDFCSLLQVNERSRSLDDYLPLPEREFFFSKIFCIPEQRFIRECLFIINRDYDPHRIKIFTARLNAFKKVTPTLNDKNNKDKSAFLPLSLQNMYIDIKKRIILNETVDFDQYRFEDIEMILSFMKFKKIIGKYTATFKKIELTFNFKRKYNMKYDEILYNPVQDENFYNEMHKYYATYFNIVYYNIMRNGTTDINILSANIEILEPFELTDFFSYFCNYFETQKTDDKIYVSIIENNDMYLKFPDL
ncbi:hypothetical protein M153_65450001202, partial [Pseudoloma neurophilia]